MIGPPHSAVQLASASHRNVRLLALGLSALLGGCQPDLVVGKWECLQSDAANGGTTSEPVAMPWSSDFENAFCDYGAPAGFCYAAERASYEIVTSPVRSGTRAAAFSVVSDGDLDGMQARCVRQGELPDAAYYSAYFLVPTAPTAARNWNLMHFRSGGDQGRLHGVWDVSLEHQTDGSFQVYVFDHLRMSTRVTTGVPAVPIGTWFQLEVYYARSTDNGGELTVYQDGQLALELEGLATDDVRYEWYVGNLADSLTPPESTVYVDDVLVSLTRP